MATTITIPGLSSANLPDGTELLIVSQSGATRKLTLSDLMNAFRDTVVLSANGTYTVKLGVMIDKIMVNPTAGNISLKIGTTSGGDDILEETAITQDDVFSLDTIIYGDVQKTLYVSGITSSTKIIFYKR